MYVLHTALKQMQSFWNFDINKVTDFTMRGQQYTVQNTSGKENYIFFILKMVHGHKSGFALWAAKQPM